MLRTRIYYRVKPFVPTAIRTAVRRTVAGRLRNSVGNVWPIMPGSERAPDNWPGWPEGKKFAFVLTHDVEGPTGLDQCRALMRLEQEFGVRSSFNFIPEGGYRISAELRKELTHSGFEVGVHDLKHDGGLYRSRRDFAHSAQRINSYLREWNAAGFRSGFMLHNLDWLHQLHIGYDASTFDTDPFEPQPEGRHTIFPFWVARPSANGHERSGDQSDGYVELPYTLAQDSTLFLLLGEKGPEIWLKKLDWVAEHGGMALVNIHPDYINFSGGGPTRSAYPVTRIRELLQHVQERYGGHFWNPVPRELAHWYREVYQPQSKVGFTSERAGGEAGARIQAPNLVGRRAAVLLYSYYPADPRPRRAAEALVECGMEVDLICLRQAESETRWAEEKGVQILRLPWRKSRDSKLGYIRQYGRFLASCFGLLTLRSFKQRYDLVHVHNMPDVLVFAAIVPKLLGARIVLDLHDPMPELMMSIYSVPEAHRAVAWLKAFERWSIRFADLVFTPNIAFRKLFISRGAPEAKIKIVMNSPQEEIFDSAAFGRGDQSTSGLPPTRVSAAVGQNGSRHVQSTQTRTFYLMYHGSLVHRHGLDIAVRALAEVRQTVAFVQLDIFGYRTDYLDSVLNLANELGLDDVVTYHGAKPQTEIARNILQCDLGIIPNRYSPFTDLNFPTRIFEYLAMNRPVIAPSTQGIRDYFPEDALIYFNPDLVDSLAESIRWVWENPREVRDIVKRGRSIYGRHLWKDEKANLREAVAALVSAAKD